MRSFLAFLCLFAALGSYAFADDTPVVHNDMAIAAPTGAPAQPSVVSAAPPSWQAQLLMAVVGFVGLVLAGLATPVAVAIARKFHIDAKVIEESHIGEIVQQGIQYAEEQSKKGIAAKLPPKKGDEKMDIAAKFIADKIAAAKLSQKGADAIKALVESKIGATRNGVASILALVFLGFGFTGCFSQARAAEALHAKADRDSAIITLEAVKQLRATGCNPGCWDVNLKVIESQAQAVLR